MQQDNNIENKLRQLDDELQPDLSNMDAHWQQMQAMLQPGGVPVKKGLPKWMLNALSVAAVIVLVGAAFLYLSKGQKNNDGATVQNSVAADEKANNATPVFNNDSVETAATATTITDAVQYEDKGNRNADFFGDDSSPYFSDSLKINFTPCDACPSKKVDSGIVTAANRKMMLDNLFEQLKKEEQKFIVDNSRDTLLRFKEGTELLIPANSFGGVNGVELTVREFYKKSDIVLNQLNTASNKEQLVTGGMIELKAMYKESKVDIDKQKSVVLFMPGSNVDMKDMQMFYGEHSLQTKQLPVLQPGDKLNKLTENPGSKLINWVARPQYFLKRKVITEVRVLNLADIPWLVNETAKRKTGYFMYNEDSIAMEKKELKRLLKEKYGYSKVKLTSSIRNRFVISVGDLDKEKFDRRYSEHVGDSIWMDKTVADKYHLNATNTRKVVIEESSGSFSSVVTGDGIKIAPGRGDTMPDRIWNALNTVDYRYSINLNQLGWINCDRFYSDSRKKIQYKVDLGDSATNYYTMLVFDKINSMMTGYIDGSKVTFQNIPEGEPVKIISIGINKKGETVYSLTSTTTSNQELTGLQFETVSAPDLKAALSKMDQ